VTVAIITGTARPTATHIPLNPEAGHTRYDISYANATDLHSVDRSRLRRYRGRLHPAELLELESAIRTYLGLQHRRTRVPGLERGPVDDGILARPTAPVQVCACWTDRSVGGQEGRRTSASDATVTAWLTSSMQT